MRAMKIAVVAPLWAPLAEPELYGSHQVIRDLARALADRGHDVTVYAAAGSRIAGIPVVGIDVPFAARACYPPPAAVSHGAVAMAYAALYSEVQRRGCEVISQHAFEAPAIAGAAAWPTVHTLHRPPYTTDVIAALYETPGAIATVSHHAAVRWRGVLHRDVSVIPNGIPRARLESTRTEPFALVAGRIAPEKGTAVALRVARALRLRVIIAGVIHDREYFDREVAPLLDSATLVGVLPRDELWRVMSRAAVTLAPVAWDAPFGLVAAEAQRVGCPVAAFRRGGLPEIVIDAITGYLAPPEDLASLVAVTRRCLDLDRGAIRRTTRNRFSLDACAEAHERLLAQQIMHVLG